jgi:hypothetical protein
MFMFLGSRSFDQIALPLLRSRTESEPKAAFPTPVPSPNLSRLLLFEVCPTFPEAETQGTG